MSIFINKYVDTCIHEVAFYTIPIISFTQFYYCIGQLKRKAIIFRLLFVSYIIKVI